MSDYDFDVVTGEAIAEQAEAPQPSEPKDAAPAESRETPEPGRAHHA
jgi:hypothetical protein